MTSVSRVTKFAMTMVEASNRPAMIGNLRAMFADPVRRSSKSEHKPPVSTPTQAAMNGRMVKKPTLIQPICRSVAR